MTNKNLSGVFRGIHDVRAEILDMPEVSENAVIIKVGYAGICGTDLHIYHEGLIPTGSVLGHEFSGHITEIGKNGDHT